MAVNCGIIGLPNVGKSTIFNALTRANAAVANYPFCTVEPNVGIVEVPDERITRLSEIYRPKKRTPTNMEFVDIAGLVEGASKGKGSEINFWAISGRSMRWSTSSAVSTIRRSSMSTGRLTRSATWRSSIPS